VSPMESSFRELTAEPRTESVALSHLSLELGHLMLEDIEPGKESLHAQFERVAPWVRAATELAKVDAQGRTARVSTCLLIDDYFTRFATPASVLPDVLDMAKECGLEIDYLARQSGCVESDGVALASLVAGRLTGLPTPGTNGSRPPAVETGWLCNGQRAPSGGGSEAMRRPAWSPPVELGATNHSVFVDVELWSEKDGRRIWSCAYLAAVWQLLRLGMLRNGGANVVRPRPVIGDFPDDWDELPPITQLNPTARPFSAYRTLSVLSARYLSIEHAVRVILDQIAPPSAVNDEVVRRSEHENVRLPEELTDRINYVFFDNGR
jgi:hypothetical protein